MSYTDEQIDQAIEVMFKKYDVDRNGVLDRHELVQFLSDAYKKIGGKASNLGEVNSLLDKYDVNRDGVIDAKELRTIFKSVFIS